MHYVYLYLSINIDLMVWAACIVCCNIIVYLVKSGWVHI